MKQYLMLTQKEYDKYIFYIEPYWDILYMRTIDTDPLNKNQVKSIIDYDGFSNCIKYNRLTELWDLKYSDALNIITNNQSKYLRTPLYIVYDLNDYIYHMETGIEEFWSRFRVKKEDQK